MNEYAVAYGIGAAILIYMTYRVYTNTPKSEPKLYFSLLGTAAAIWITSEFFYYSLSGRWSLVFYFVKYIGIILLPYAVLMAALTIPIRSRVMKIKYLPILLLLPALVSIFFLITDP